ncbi:MAG: DMT family transporter [Cyanobacteria bacterium P01_E01_bin.34]
MFRLFNAAVKRPPSSSFLTLGTAVLAVSFAPIFIRLSETELGPNGAVLNRMLVFFLVFGFGRFLSQSSTVSQRAPLKSTPPSIERPTHITPRKLVLLLGTGAISIASLGLWSASLQYTTVAKSMLLNNLTPIFTTLGSWLLFSKRFERQFLVGVAIALTGAIGIGLEDLHSSDGLLIGDIYALLSAVFLSAYLLLIERLRCWFSATTIVLWRCGVGSTLLVPIVWITEGQLVPTTDIAIVAALGMGLVSEGLGQRLLADCMDRLSSSFVSLAMLVEPVVSALLAWALFSEAVEPSTWLGFAVVLSGIYLAQASGSAVQSVPSNDVDKDFEEIVEQQERQLETVV